MSSPLAPILPAVPARRQRGGARPAQLALLALASALLIAAGGVAALGIGEPRQLSPLFEPLRVDVPVDAAGVEPAAVKVGVSFGGVDPAVATELDRRLRREWRLDPRGQYVLRISADTAIHEPLLQMRVEVGDGRIQAVRELTLLFDPAPAAPLPEATAPPAVPAPARVPPAAFPAAAPQPVVPIRPGAAAAPPAPVAAVQPPPAKAVLPTVAAPPPEAAGPAAASAQAQQDRIVSTRLREQALSSADRWQRLPIAAGDTLASLAERARGGQTAIPLSLVEMLLRWLNPRAFDGVAGQPLAGAELRFPRPESLAAQLAASDGRWLTEAAASSAAVAVPVAALAGSPATDAFPMTEPGARLLPAAAALGAVAMPAAAPNAAASGTPAGGAAGLFGSLSMWIGSVLLTSALGVLLSLKLLGRLPASTSAEPLPGVVVARSLSATASASASSEALSPGPQALAEAPATFTRLDFAEPVAVERRDREGRGRT
ncbi:type IV pilus assembly protein FimV [Nevskia sp.]|uniref:type IV pilus assembly protein FimV n=1 Tax=Nevskia sp. TaxID=1929292 RepID=UPI003F6F3300